MDLEKFHRNLIGPNSVQDVHRQLYRAVPNGVRGFLLDPSSWPSLKERQASAQDFERFVAVAILALHDTTFPSRGNVHLLTSPAIVDWVDTTLHGLCRRLIAARKGLDKAQTVILAKAMRRIVIVHTTRAFTQMPERWVTYGYASEETLPKWMQGKVLT